MGFSHKKGLSFEVFFGGKSGLWVCWSADRFFAVFVSFSGGSDLPSARAVAVETQFSMFEPASKRHGFSKNCKGISGINGFQINKKTS